MAESVSKPHKLIITELDEVDPEGEPYREWEIIHPEGCPQVEVDDPFITGGKFHDYDCMVAHEILHCGLDSLWPEWTTLAAGEFEIEAFSSYDPLNMEYDGGLRLLEED